jgi:hypothetical protein
MAEPENEHERPCLHCMMVELIDCPAFASLQRKGDHQIPSIAHHDALLASELAV